MPDGMLPTTAKWAANYIKNFPPGEVPQDVLGGLTKAELRVFRNNLKEYFDPEDISNYLEDLSRVWWASGKEPTKEYVGIRYELVSYLALTSEDYVPKDYKDRMVCILALQSALRGLKKCGGQPSFQNGGKKII